MRRCTLTTITGVFFFGGLTLTLMFGVTGPFVSPLVARWLKDRKQLRLEEMKTRRIEAMAKMSQKGQQKLLEQVPDWSDKGDPEELDAWKAVRAELNRAG